MDRATGNNYKKNKDPLNSRNNILEEKLNEEKALREREMPKLRTHFSIYSLKWGGSKCIGTAPLDWIHFVPGTLLVTKTSAEIHPRGWQKCF